MSEKHILYDFNYLNLLRLFMAYLVNYLRKCLKKKKENVWWVLDKNVYSEEFWESVIDRFNLLLC